MDLNSIKSSKIVLLTAAACILVVGAGALGMAGMAASKRPPVHKPEHPTGLSVSVIPLEDSTIRLTATGYGQAAPVNVREICPQVSGNILEKHPALDQGGMVEKGEILLAIDATDYVIASDKARVQVKLAENAVAQYRVSLDRDRDRLTAVKNNTALARAEYLRLKTLYEESRVGTLSGVETAERSYNSLLDTQKTLEKTISLYPLQIQEAQNDLARDKADFKTARLNLDRCEIPAPFSGRVRTASIETGTYITAGTSALILADDRLLEIQVPLSDKDAFDTLGLRNAPTEAGWVSDLDTIGCRLETVTGQAFSTMPAKVHRAVRYDADSRTLYLAVRVAAENNPSGVPLLDGMFCKVSFEGRSVDNAVKIPLSALNSDNTVFVAREDRLKTLDVSKIMSGKTHVYVSGDFQPGDRLIITPLTNPMDNTRLTLISDIKTDQVARVSGDIHP